MRTYRKKHRLLPVSFFAFQDIITALAGCMLIFVLTLAAARSYSGPSESSAGDFSQKEYDILLEKIRLSRSMLTVEERSIAQLQQQFESDRISEQNKNFNQELERSTQQLEKSLQQRSQMLKSLQKEFDSLKKLNRQLAADNAELFELIKKSAELEKQYRSQHKKLVFANLVMKEFYIH